MSDAEIEMITRFEHLLVQMSNQNLKTQTCPQDTTQALQKSMCELCVCVPAYDSRLLSLKKREAH